MIYQIALEHTGFRSALDINGNKYHALLDSAWPDLIVLDMHLPLASGVEICDDFSDTIIVVTTADITKMKALQGKVDHILIKPVSAASLLKTAEAVKG